ncbi:MAG TPA: radical SAM protein [Pseudomonadales bacterium]|nr:radical SAM protein [Pseudomonadales bacterium]
MKVLDRVSDQYRIIKHQRYYAENLTIIGVEPYIKCGYRCFYCITDSQGKTRLAEPDLASFQQRFLQELEDFPSDEFMFGVSLATDAYSDIEAEYGYTRFVIDELSRRNRRFSITTKSPLAVRDIDLFQRMSPDRYKVILSFTASTTELANRVEPQAPSPESRLEALHQLHEAGVNACVLMAPWIPGLTDTDRLLSLFPKGIKVFFQPIELGDHFEEVLDKQRPQFSASLFMGEDWTQDEINRAYIRECNSVGKKYWKDFQMEWRHPITLETHQDNSGYLKRMRPGRYDPDQWVAEHHVEPAVRR